MTERLKESLSAVIDGEADEFELRRVLDEVGRNPGLKDVWHRYHLIGAQVKNEQPPEQLLTAVELQTLTDNVWQALEREGELPKETSLELAPAYVAETITDEATVAEPRQRYGTWTGIGVAAGVALMVTAAFLSFDTEEPTLDVAQQALDIEGPVFEITTAVSPSDLQRANAYMLHHVQQTAMNKAGVASFVKVVTFEAPE